MNFNRSNVLLVLLRFFELIVSRPVRCGHVFRTMLLAFRVGEPSVTLIPSFEKADQDSGRRLLGLTFSGTAGFASAVGIRVAGQLPERVSLSAGLQNGLAHRQFAPGSHFFPRLAGLLGRPFQFGAASHFFR